MPTGYMMMIIVTAMINIRDKYEDENGIEEQEIIGLKNIYC